MILDGKGRAVRGKMSKKDKRQYAIKMSEVDVSRAMKNKNEVKTASMKYREYVRKQQADMGIKTEDV